MLPPGEAGEWDSSDDEASSSPPATKKLAAEAADGQPKPASVHVDGFVPSASFEGARGGLVFKQGAAGLGYYPDHRPMANLTAQVASLAMPVASSSPSSSSSAQADP